MATNAYRYSELWYFDTEPSVYHGWVITTSSDSIRAAHFKNKMTCRNLEHDIGKLVPGDVSAELVAACLLIHRVGHEADRDWAADLMSQEFENEGQALTDELQEKLDKLIEQYLEKE